MTLSQADRLELQQLLMKYTHTLDYGSVEDMGEIWTEDCEFTVDQPATDPGGSDRAPDKI